VSGSNPEASFRYAPVSLWIAKAPCPGEQGAVNYLWIFQVST